MRLRGPKRVKNPDKVQPEFNASESATLSMCNAMEALLNATACRAEDKKAVTEMIALGRSQVLEAYKERTSEKESTEFDYPAYPASTSAVEHQ